MKTIIFNTDSLILGGAEKIALEYVKILSKYNNVILLINEDNGENGNLLKKHIPKNVKVEYVVEKEIIEKINIYREKKKSNVLYKILYSIFLKKRRKSYKKNIGEKIKKYKHDFLFDFYCKIPMEYLDERSILFLHSSLEGTKKRVKDILRLKFNKVKNIVVVTGDLKKEAEEMFPESKEKFKKIYNFFDFINLKKLSENQEYLTLEEKKLLDENFILACSRIDKKKDLETLINGYKLIENEVDEKLYIAGDGPNKKDIQNLVKKNNLEDKVIFLGNQVNPYIWMKNCQCFVHSSKKEGFGMVLVEAMSFGKDILASDCPVGPREILNNGEYGNLFSVGNYIEMAEKLKKILITDRDNSEKIIKRAMDFSLENAKLEIEKLLK